MTLEQHLHQAKDLVHWLGGKLDGADVPSDLRSRLAGGCFHSAVEYHMAIVLLVEARYYASAFALIRIIYEAYVNGVWLGRCANDVEIDSYVKRGKSPRFSDRVAEIESLPGYEARVLSNVTSCSWKAMNSYTHTGYLQIVRRQTETALESNYSDDEVIQALNFSGAVSCLVAIELSALCQSTDLANVILQKAGECWPHDHPVDIDGLQAREKTTS